MKLELTEKQTNQPIEEFEASDWVEAVKYVEQNKERFLSLGHQELTITNHATSSICFWKLETEARPMLLTDRLHESSKRR